MRLVVALVALAAACSARTIEHAAAPPAPHPDPVAIGPSIYGLPISMIDADGHSIALDAERGHPTLISMFYGSCAAACPLLIGAIGDVVAKMPAGVRDDVRVLLVSFDPARDTPAHLRDLVRVHRLDARWTLAAAGEVDARTLAAVLGIRYRAVAGGQFFHTSAIVVLDREGQPVARMDGIGDPTAVVAALADQASAITSAR